MNYIVFDLEWNQSGYGKENDKVRKVMPFEIIEIGAVKLNEHYEELGQFHRYIKPQVYKELHYMTKRIVHITKEELANGVEFPQAAADFFQWCGEDVIFCTWGSSDLTELQRNIRYFHLEPISSGPFMYYDIQKFYRLLYDEGKDVRTLHYAADYFHLEENLKFHSALNDALYTAQIMRHLDMPKVKKYYSFDCYWIPSCKEEEIYAVFDTYSKYISRGFETREEMLADKEVNSMKCYICGKKCRKKIRWFSGSGRNYYGLGICKEHGYLKGKLRVRHSENDMYYAVKTLKLVDEEGAAKVKDRQNKLRQKRREKRKKEPKNQDS